MNICHRFEVNANVAVMTVIEIRPHCSGWKVFEAPGIEPVFPEKRQAINYAQNRASFRSGEIRILGSNGIVGRTILSGSTRGKILQGKDSARPGCGIIWLYKGREP